MIQASVSQTLLSRILAAPDSPTADLYFMNACRDFLDAGISRIAPTVFMSNCACLVMRHAMRSERLPEGRRLVYFLDDAVEQGAGDASLPFLYRQKLRLVDRSAVRSIGRSASTVVVSSAELAGQIAPRTETRLIHPYWSEPISGQSHFAPVLDRHGWIDIAFLGSVTHAEDLAFLWPVLGDVIQAHHRVRLHLAERHRVPQMLAMHPRVRRIPGLGWGAYRKGLAERRFHLALYPLMDTPFNRARSLNKLIEHGVAGAAAIYSRGWREAWRAEQGGAGLVLRNERCDWRSAIEHLLAHPEVMCGLAAGASALARRLNRAEPQRRLWAELLGVPTYATA